MHFQGSHHYAWAASFPIFSSGGGGTGQVSLQLQWLEIKWRGLLGKEKMWRKFVSLFPYHKIFSVWYWSKQLLSFLLISQAFPITMPFVFVNLYTAHEDLTYSKDNISASNYSINANGIVSSSRMKRKYNSWQLRIHSSSVTENW